MKNLPILILIAVVIILVMCRPGSEKFSTSGLSISDRECMKLADVYSHPRCNDPECRSDYRRRICGMQRRQTVEPSMGNYWNEYGVLV